jgi:hypothetical protein
VLEEEVARPASLLWRRGYGASGRVRLASSCPTRGQRFTKQLGRSPRKVPPLLHEFLVRIARHGGARFFAQSRSAEALTPCSMTASPLGVTSVLPEPRFSPLVASRMLVDSQRESRYRARGNPELEIVLNPLAVRSGRHSTPGLLASSRRRAQDPVVASRFRAYLRPQVGKTRWQD